MTAQEMYEYLKRIIKEGYGEYRLTCDGGLNPVGEGIIHEEDKEIEVG